MWASPKCTNFKSIVGLALTSQCSQMWLLKYNILGCTLVTFYILRQTLNLLMAFRDYWNHLSEYVRSTGFSHIFCFHLALSPILAQPLVSPFPDERDPKINGLDPSGSWGPGAGARVGLGLDKAFSIPIGLGMRRLYSDWADTQISKRQESNVTTTENCQITIINNERRTGIDDV